MAPWPVRCGAVRCGRRRSSDLDDRRVGLSPGARNTTESASSRAHRLQLQSYSVAIADCNDTLRYTRPCICGYGDDSGTIRHCDSCNEPFHVKIQYIHAYHGLNPHGTRDARTLVARRLPIQNPTHHITRDRTKCSFNKFPLKETTIAKKKKQREPVRALLR
jgi:hypothetical protein